MKYTDQSFYRLLGEFLTVHLPRRKNASEHTIKSYTDTFNLFLDFMNQEKNTPTEKVGFHSLNEATIGEFLDWLQDCRHCKNSTYNLRLAAIRAFAKYAGSIDVSKRYIHVALSEIPKKRKEDAKIVEHLSPNAMQTVMTQPNANSLKGIRNLFYMTLLYDTAARNSELLNIHLGDILDIGGKYSVLLHGKCRKDRVLSLEPKTADHYQHYLELFHPVEIRNNNDYLFYTVSHGRRNQMSDDCVGRFIKEYGYKARAVNPEVPSVVHPHQFRHTRAMHLYQNGMQLPELQQILGHASLSTVLIYAHADTEMKREAIAKSTISNRVVKDAPATAIYKDNDSMIRKLCGLKS